MATKNGIEVGYAKEGDKWDFYVVGNLTTELTTSGFELCNFPSGFMVGRASTYPVGSVYNACVMLDAGTGKIKLRATTGTVGKDLYINSRFMALSCNRRV